MFSRASIINKIGNAYNVFYMDYGNTECVSSDDVFELPEELKKVRIK